MWVIVKMLLYCLQTVRKTSYYNLLDMVGCTIQHSRDPHSRNILIIILWAMVGISISPVRHILPIIPHMVNFWSSPRLGLISLNKSFCRSINSSLGSLWTNWDHGWVEKKTAYNIPMCCGNFLQHTICGGHPLKATWTNFPLSNFLIFTNLLYLSRMMS